MSNTTKRSELVTRLEDELANARATILETGEKMNEAPCALTRMHLQATMDNAKGYRDGVLVSLTHAKTILR